MQIKNTTERYGMIAQLLHWSIVALIIVQLVLAEQAEEAGDIIEKAQILNAHRSMGMTVFMLAVLRIVWRFVNVSPAVLPSTKTWQHRVASLMHWALYALILAAPLAGWLMTSAKNETVSWFGLFNFPGLITPSESMTEQLEELHEALAGGIFILAILHAVAALKHHFIDKDNVLRRMLPLKLR
jgi:cytochrome b561